MVKGKRGWVRIVEAVIAILLIIGVLIFFYTRTANFGDKGEYIRTIERTILEEASNNATIRTIVLAGDSSNEILYKFVEDRLANYPDIEFDVSICNPNEACAIAWPEGKDEIYVEEIFISANLETYSPKKLKLFVWER